MTSKVSIVKHHSYKYPSNKPSILYALKIDETTVELFRDKKQAILKARSVRRYLRK